MTIADVLAKLEGLDGGAEMVEAIKAETSRLNGEAKKHREAKESAEAEAQKLNSERDEWQKKYDAVQKSTQGGGTEVETLKAEMKKLKEQYEASEKKRMEAEQQRITADITSQTISALTKQNAVSPEEFAKLLTGAITVAEDGSYRYERSDGTVGSISDCVTDWLKDKPWAVKNTQKPGSGGSDYSGGGTADDVKAIETAIMG